MSARGRASLTVATLAFVLLPQNARAQMEGGPDERAPAHAEPPARDVIPEPPGEPADPEAGAAAALSDPHGEPAPAPATVVVTPYTDPPGPAADDGPRQAEALLDTGRPVEALALVEDIVLVRQQRFDVAETRRLVQTTRAAVHPAYDHVLLPLGGVFLGVGAAGIIASLAALFVDSIDFSGTGPDPIPYGVSFTVAGLGVLGGLATLIAGAVQHRSGEVGAFRNTQHQILRALRVARIARARYEQEQRAR